MSLIITAQSKNNITITNLDKGLDNTITWDEATFSWNDASGTWDTIRFAVSKQTKNSISITNETKN